MMMILIHTEVVLNFLDGDDDDDDEKYEMREG
jgi:hypothetical protein